MGYETPADARLYPPQTDDHKIDRNAIDEAISRMDALDSPISGGGNERVHVKEMFYEQGTLTIRLDIGEWYTSIQIPTSPSDDFLSILSDLNRSFEVASKQSGYFLSNRDVSLVDTFTPDQQGRITLGREYADRDVKVIVTTEE